MSAITSLIVLFLSIQLFSTQELPPNIPHTVPQINTDCGQNSSFKRCVTRCPITCTNYLNPPKGCVTNCAIGCECHEGFIKVDKGPYSQCIRPFECSQFGKKPKFVAKKLFNKNF